MRLHGVQLATDEINKAGGIAGRPIELVICHTQSDNTRFQKFMRRVPRKDKVDVVFAGFSSASREAYRPIVDQLNGLAFHNNQYEGGVCDAHASTNQNIQKAKPDLPATLLVGAAQSSYCEQASAANLHVPMGISINIGQAHEHKRF